MTVKRRLFALIMLLPGIALAGLLLLIGSEILQIRRIEPDTIHAQLKEHLANKRPARFPPPDEFSQLEAGRESLFLFGASSVVLSDGGTMADYLKQNHPELQVINFGVSGFDSFSVRERVRQVLAIARPDVLLLYYGHNDYNNAYQGFIMPNYFNQFESELRFAYFVRGGSERTVPFSNGSFYWFARRHRPKFFQLLQRLRVIQIDGDDFRPINRSILEHFKDNTHAIIEMAESLNVPMVLMTPIGNLHAEPYGDVDTTTVLYEDGMATAPGQASMDLLRRARDSEIFTFDLRAKSALVDYIRNSSHEGVYLLDLEKTLTDQGFEFGDSDFVDYFHFNDRSHRLLADVIYTFLAENNLLRHGYGPSRPEEAVGETGAAETTGGQVLQGSTSIRIGSKSSSSTKTSP